VWFQETHCKRRQLATLAVFPRLNAKGVVRMLRVVERSILGVGIWLSFLVMMAVAHEGPDPRCSWLMSPALVDTGVLRSQLGPNLRIGPFPRFEKVGKLDCIRLQGDESMLVASETWPVIRELLPSKTLTVAAWVSLDSTLPFGGIVSAFQDNGGNESGWVLGYNDKHFTFGLATQGADDGDGMMTYLSGRTPIEAGKWYHVCATYDGELMQLWVNGELEGESRDQSGPILMPKEARLAVGAYLDSNESFAMQGRLAQAVIYDLAAKKAWVQHDFQEQQDWIALPPQLDPSRTFQFVVKPYLQYATRDSIRVLCEVNRPSKVRVRYGETTRFTNEVEATSSDQLLHTVVLDGLLPETAYYYQVVVREDGQNEDIQCDASSFQTASLALTPYAFCVMGDTQGNPKVNGQLASHAWALRPNFLVIPGDLVDDGPVKGQWVNEFFGSMSPLFARIPFYPVLGNHERNADHYYRYMDLPKPEYYYSFQYGNAAFMMIDSNKKMDPQSEQYLWLEAELKRLDQIRKEDPDEVKWRFVSFHHPSYSSDEDDYGNLWKGKSTWGDLRVRPLVELFDRYDVDIVWNGHIHSYERTWPIEQGRVVQKDGTVYMITGGGGGGLEQAGPIRPPFQNNVRRGHHFVYVAINGGTLELKSYDLEGRLFDSWTLSK
jgi:acid phosphatase type 7